MSITITATAGSATANSFVTLAEFRIYLTQRLNTSCILESRSAADLSIALIEAGREFNEKAWRGVKADDDQAMSWPRRYVPVLEGLEYYDADEIPQAIKDAQCERAIELLEATDSKGQSDPGVISRFKQGDVEIQYDTRQSAMARTRNARVNRLLNGYLLQQAAVVRA